MKHGGDIYTDGVLKGRELLDFSSNINPLGIPESFKKNINEAIENLNKYPDIHYRKLKGYLKQYINNSYKKEEFDFIREEDLVLGNGAAEIIDKVISCFKNIAICCPSFGEYEEDAKKYNCDITYIKLNKNMEYDYDEILNKIDKCQALMIGNPNNPNGGVIDKKKFKNIIEYCDKNNKTIIIDEAFIEFTGDMKDSFLKEMKENKSIFLIRALTKFYAMPGIRLGYGITKDKKILDFIREKQNPWNINTFAEVAAKYVLKDEKYIEESITWIKKESEFFLEELRKIKFIDRVYKTKTNFVLCKLKNIDCHELYNLCNYKNVIIRKCDNFRGLDSKFVRFAIKDRDNNKKLLNILRNIRLKTS